MSYDGPQKPCPRCSTSNFDIRKRCRSCEVDLDKPMTTARDAREALAELMAAWMTMRDRRSEEPREPFLRRFEAAMAAGEAVLRSPPAPDRDAVLETLLEEHRDRLFKRLDDGRYRFNDDGIVTLRLSNKEARRALSASPGSSGWRTPQAVRDLLAERQRQVAEEGWTPKHDDTHVRGEMMDAAICYLHRRREERMFGQYTPTAPAAWPWDRTWWKPTGRRRDLVKAGALILAEIERLDRAAAPAPPVDATASVEG